MKLYLAPMEGITGIDFRKNLNKHFGNVDVYTTAFIPASKNLNKKQIRDLDPDNNQGMKLVPQLIGNDAQEMLDMCRKMQSFGYDEININLGCPSGTVTSKKRGSGLLLYPEILDHFLEELFSATDMKISVKTRIGYFSTDEWEELLEIYARYPLQELIIHPRIRQEFYSKTPHYDAFARAVDKIRVPLVYNGDILKMSNLVSFNPKNPNEAFCFTSDGTFYLFWINYEKKQISKYYERNMKDLKIVN